MLTTIRVKTTCLCASVQSLPHVWTYVKSSLFFGIARANLTFQNCLFEKVECYLNRTICVILKGSLSLTLVSLKHNAMNCFEISNSTLAIKTVRLLMFSCPRTTHVLCKNLRREYNDSLVSNNCSNQLWPILTRFFFPKLQIFEPGNLYEG